MRRAVLIPSYNPPANFPDVVRELQALGLSDITVVNDGSCPRFLQMFQVVADLGVSVIHLEKNYGKGTAIKHGLALMYERQDLDFIVTCDDDGQHLPADVARVVSGALVPETFYLGVRAFDRNVPWKSFLGNKVMALLFFVFTFVKIRDTQSGLRAFHRSLIPALLSSQSEGFSFETVSLFRLLQKGVKVEQRPITTLYFDNNSHSRFRPLLDSAQVVWDLLTDWVRACFAPSSL